MAATGKDLLKLARKHIGEKYVFGANVPKNNPGWIGPWDCAEFISWVVYQTVGQLFGCGDDAGNPATADAYTGYWKRDAETVLDRVSPQDAAIRPGGIVLRVSHPDQKVGHIVFADGEGGTVEAHSTRRGVIASVLEGRRWDTGILIPGVAYEPKSAAVDLGGGDEDIYRLAEPHMQGPMVKRIQRALKAAGFNPGDIDGDFGDVTHAAVLAFQVAKGLVPDGEVGTKTAKALRIKL